MERDGSGLVAARVHRGPARMGPHGGRRAAAELGVGPSALERPTTAVVLRPATSGPANRKLLRAARLVAAAVPVVEKLAGESGKEEAAAPPPAEEERRRRRGWASARKPRRRRRAGGGGGRQRDGLEDELCRRVHSVGWAAVGSTSPQRQDSLVYTPLAGARESRVPAQLPAHTHFSELS